MTPLELTAHPAEKLTAHGPLNTSWWPKMIHWEWARQTACRQARRCRRLIPNVSIHL
jgi:hypothetical protein